MTMCCQMSWYRLVLITQWLMVMMLTTNGLIKERNYERQLHFVSRYEDLKLEEFGLASTGNYTTFLFMNETLLVGSRNHILVFNITTGLNYMKNISWVPEESRRRYRCITSGFPQDECYNFVKVLAVYNNVLLACGTNSFYPTCSWRNTSTLQVLDGTSPFFGKRFVPYSPLSKSTYTFSDDGRFFTGDDKGIFSIEFKKFRPFLLLSTKLNRENWVDDPVFHRSFLIGDYIYFFFDEFARECSECDAVRYSRVARICKGDDGGSEVMNWINFVTFQKARLNCSLSGTYPFHFNILRDIFWDSDTKTFHGIFTTERSHMRHTSAICSYSLSDIDRVFSGKYKYRDDNTWRMMVDPGHIAQCKVNRKSLGDQQAPAKFQGRMLTGYLTSDAISDTNKRILTSDTVQCRASVALYYLNDIRFFKVAVITFHYNQNHNAEVWYIATDRGTILKLSKIPSLNTFCIFEEYNIFQTRSIEEIKAMELSADKEYLIVGSDNKLTKLPLLRCDSYASRRSCLDAGDPLCGWSATEGKCTSWNKQDDMDWEQNITSCQQRAAEWSEWSPWSECKQRDGNLCLCRRRTCVNARMFYKCNGSEIELKNCTADVSSLLDKENWRVEGVIHGGWSHWSQWTNCLRGYKNRSRTCTEPSPRNGGLNCPGSHREYVLCEPTRFDDKATYLWTSWSRVRGPEKKAMRYKISCTSKAVVMKSLRIDVVDNETVNCNKELCKDPPKRIHHLLTDWSPWIYCNETTEKVRMRQLCVKDLSSQWSCDQHGVESEYRPPTTTPETFTNTPEATTNAPEATTNTPETTYNTPETAPNLPKQWSNWSRCACNHGVSLNDGSPGIQHRTIERDGETESEYRTCLCKAMSLSTLGTTTSTRGTIEANVKYKKTDLSDSEGYSLTKVVVIVSVCCLVSVALTALLLIFCQRRKAWQTKKVKLNHCQKISTPELCVENGKKTTNV